MSALLLITALWGSQAFSGSLQENIDSNMGLRAAVVDAKHSQQLNSDNVLEAMLKNPDAAALIFLYAIETDIELLDALIAGTPEALDGAVIDAVLIAVKYDLPVLERLLQSLATNNVPLAKEVIYAVTEVFPEKAKQVFDVLVAANVEATDSFEQSYTAALAAMESEGTQNGELYEAYEPEDDVSPA